MSTIIVGGQILRGEPGYTDFSGKTPPPPQPARAVYQPPTKEQELENNKAFAARIENAVKELRKTKPAPSASRAAELETEVRQLIGTMTGQIQAQARRHAQEILLKLFAPRFARLARIRSYTDYFQIVQDTREFSFKCSHSGTVEELCANALKAVELFRAGCEK